MAKLVWDETGKRTFETGVDHGILYLPDSNGAYSTGVAWNGLTGVTESPSGAEQTALYADNIKYLNMTSAEEFGATITAYTYPDEFGQCDGSAELTTGVLIGQQARKPFGLRRTIRLSMTARKLSSSAGKSRLPLLMSRDSVRFLLSRSIPPRQMLRSLLHLRTFLRVLMVRLLTLLLRRLERRIRLPRVGMREAVLLSLIPIL